MTVPGAHGELGELLTEATSLAHTDLRAASIRVDAILAEATPRSDPILPDALYLKARLTAAAGRPLDALELIERARGSFLTAGRRWEGLRTDLGRMHVLDDLGRHQEALALGQALIDSISGEPGLADHEELLASALGNVGVALGFVGEHDRALTSYREAARWWQRLGRRDEATIALANQGIELLALGQPASALEALSHAATQFREDGEDLSLAKTLGHRGRALAALGRFMQALDDLAAARSLYASTDSTSTDAGTEQWRLAIESAATLLALGVDDEALTILSDVRGRLATAGLRHDLATCEWLSGLAHQRGGSGSLAQQCFETAATLYQEVDDAQGVARTLICLSDSVDGQQRSALLARARQALAEQSAPDVTIELDRRAARDCGHFGENCPDLERATRLADALGLHELRQALLLEQGKLLLLRGDVDAAVAVLERSIQLADEVRSGLTAVALRIGNRHDEVVVSELCIGALLARGSPEDLTRAATLSDGLKARGLADVMRGGLPLRWPGADPETAGRRAALDAAYSRLAQGDHTQRRLVRQEIDDLERSISAAHALQPNLVAHWSSAGQGRVDLSAATLSYQLLGDEVMAFVDDRQSVRVVRDVVRRDELARLLSELEVHLGSHASRSSRLAEGRVRACQKVLRALYECLVRPVESLLPGLGDSPQPLIIVPHGLVHAVPFSALWTGDRYLAQLWCLSLAPSVDVAAAAAARPPRAGGSVVVGFADENAPQIDAEVASVARLASEPVTVLRGSGATRDAVLQTLDGAALVHLACHGLFRPENPAFSSLRLADGWLRAADVSAADLRGATVVLSSCESGRVGGRKGHAAVGLAQGFLAAGARTVIVSQWLVDDQATEEIMSRMHQRLAAGEHPVAALRGAQLALVDERPHPYFWAPFVAVGAPAGATS